jgi:hypothetical protein
MWEVVRDAIKGNGPTLRLVVILLTIGVVLWLMASTP